MQGKEMKRNMLAHRWYLIYATMPIVFMSEMVLSHLSFMVESCFSSLWLMHGQIVSRGNSTGLRHINILLDLSFTRDFRMLLCNDRHNGEDIGPLGRKLILLSSHVGSLRFMT